MAERPHQHQGHLHDVFEGLNKRGPLYLVYEDEIRPVMEALAALPPVEGKSFQFKVSDGQPGSSILEVYCWMGAPESSARDESDHRKEISLELTRVSGASCKTKVSRRSYSEYDGWETWNYPWCENMAELRAILGNWIAECFPEFARTAKKAFEPVVSFAGENLRTDTSMRAERPIQFKARG